MYFKGFIQSAPSTAEKLCYTFPGDSDKVSINFNYDLSSNLQDKKQSSFTILKIVLMQPRVYGLQYQLKKLTTKGSLLQKPYLDKVKALSSL